MIAGFGFVPLLERTVNPTQIKPELWALRLQSGSLAKAKEGIVEPSEFEEAITATIPHIGTIGIEVECGLVVGTSCFKLMLEQMNIAPTIPSWRILGV